jgi:hypothetical protein
MKCHYLRKINDMFDIFTKMDIFAKKNESAWERCDVLGNFGL